MSFSFQKPGNPPSRPSSHHRRQSSVSTRRESAEMMGLPTPTSDLQHFDDVDTDSVRRRALWALEGKPPAAPSPTSSFLSLCGSVEIPDLPSEDSDSTSDHGFKSSFQILGGKRDSLGRAVVPSLATEERLQTLVEEDEDEEEDSRAQGLQDHTLGPTTLVQPKSSMANQRPGLKPLTLATSPPLLNASLPSSSQRTGLLADMPKRRSSLSYKRSNDVSSSPSTSISITCFPNALPTPEMTPVTAERPLSPSEQAFLQNNHTSLLSRITELERVLAVRTRSPSIATSSSRQLSISSVASEQPSNEMLCLVRDLKAERDDLTRDIGVYQTRIEQMEKQVNTLTRRIDAERRDAWQARERVGVLEVEKRQLLTSLERANAAVDELREASRQARAAEEHSRNILIAEQKRRETLEMQLEKMKITLPLPRTSSPSAAPSNHVVFSPISEPTITISDSENELAHYEDEDENDTTIFSDDSESSFYSPFPSNYRVEPFSLSASLQAVPLPSPSSTASSTPPITPVPFSQKALARRNSMEKEWSFPKGARPVTKVAPEVDRFFQCLDISDALPVSPPPSAGFKDKYGFFNDDDDDDDDDESPLFIIPTPITTHRADPAVSAVPTAPASRRKPVPKCDEEQLKSSGIRRVDGHTKTSSSAATADKLLDISPTFKASVVTPKRPPPSSIPKLTSSPQKGGQLPTPTSIPRVKVVPQDVPSAGKRTNIPPSLHTPTKLPMSRVASGITQSARPPTHDEDVLTGSSTATALASYLPWMLWAGAGPERAMPEAEGMPAPRIGSRPEKRPTRAHASKENPASGTSNGRLMLL